MVHDYLVQNGYYIIWSKIKLNFAILSPYFLILFLVPSGLITDKSNDLRIAIDNLIRNEKLSNIPIEIIKSEFKDDETLSKIIKILIKTPKIEKKRLHDLSELIAYSYAWTIKKFNKNIKKKLSNN